MIKVRKIKSLLGKQDDLDKLSGSLMQKYISIANGKWIKGDGSGTVIAPYRFNITLDPTHKYFIGVMFDSSISGVVMSNYDATRDIATSVSDQISVGNFIGGKVWGVQKLDSIRFYRSSGSISAEPLYAMYVDLYEHRISYFTSQQFYNMYNTIFTDIAGDKLSTVKKIYTTKYWEPYEVKKICIKGDDESQYKVVFEQQTQL